MFVLINSWQLSFFGKVQGECAFAPCSLTMRFDEKLSHGQNSQQQKIQNLSFEKKNSKIWHVGYSRHIKKVCMCFVLHVYISCFTNSFMSNACGRYLGFHKRFWKREKNIWSVLTSAATVEFLGAERMPAQALESLFYSLLHICFYILFIDSFSFMFCVFNV